MLCGACDRSTQQYYKQGNGVSPQSSATRAVSEIANDYSGGTRGAHGIGFEAGTNAISEGSERKADEGV